MKIYMLFLVVLFSWGVNAQVIDPDPDPDCPSSQQIRYYLDQDLDGIGAGPVILYSCKQLEGTEKGKGLSTSDNDCDDNDPDANIGTQWYIDADRDGYGDINFTPIYQCLRPEGSFVANGLDCNDLNFDIKNVNTYYLDADGDGYGSRKNNQKLSTCDPLPTGYSTNNYDYDDTNAQIIDAPLKLVCSEGEKIAVYVDRDRDGYGTSLGMFNCDTPPDGYSLEKGDCDDDNPEITLKYYYEDNDKDSFGDPNKRISCDYPGLFNLDLVTGETVLNELYVENALDCNDGDPLILDGYFFYRDKDGDGFGNRFVKVKHCTKPLGYVANLSDCNDNDPNITPSTIWYEDKDKDGFGDPNKKMNSCDQPDGYVDNALDSCPTQGGPNSGCISTVVDGFTNKNYIHTILPQKPLSVITSSTNRDQLIETVNYFDDRGRLTQQITIKGGENLNKNDIVTRVEYDIQGRQRKEYLPYATSGTKNGGFYSNATLETYAFYDTNKYENTLNPYSEKVLEASPLNRVQEQAAPGNDWKASSVDNTPVVPSNLPVDIVINHTVNATSSESDRNLLASSSITLAAGTWIQSGSNFSAKIFNTNNNSETDNHTIKFDWDTNITDDVIYFKVNFTDPTNTEAPSLVKDGFYALNQLYVTITKDENWIPTDGNLHTSREYKDKQGRVVLKRTYASTSSATGAPSIVEAHDTYYVYDDFGNLTYVIPPKATTADGISDIELAELCYQYTYDYRNRLIEKKIPGKDWESIVYNQLDQPILTQDANLKADNTWLFTKYDAFGRVAYTGKISITEKNRKQLQTEANAYAEELWVTRGAKVSIGGVDMHYTDGGYPKALAGEVLSITYYDDYAFLGATPQQAFIKPNTIYNEAVSDQTKTLATGSLVKILDTSYWTTTVTYYDKKARPIYIASKNEYLNTTDIIESKLDFVGKVEEIKTSHTKDSNAAIVTIDTFTYDHMGRLKEQAQKINTQTPEVIVANTYDNLGQLKSKTTGGGLQEVDYTYNVRGWLTKINDPNVALGNKLFAFGINYNTPQHGAKALFNGNIAETKWKTANDNVERYYKYEYDALNRITSGSSKDNNYSLSDVTYDKVGNIMSLTRSGFQNSSTFTGMDILGYEYDSGNKLQKVTDTGNKTYGFKDGTNTDNDFVYDANGNMIKDQNKGITGITYNHLNLPKTVTVNNADHTGDITYIYDATGVKLKKIATEGSSMTTEYAGNYVYKNGVLEFFNHPEGYVEKEADGYKYVYQFKDHLGNIRLSYKDSNKDGKITQSEIVEEKHYYPFGLQHKGYNFAVNGRKHNYGFGGKEEQDGLGLDWHDFGARNYDASLGRWMNIDPLAEQYLSLSPYNYTMNNPIFFVDPDGQEVIIHFNKTKNRLYIYDDDKWDDNLETKAVSAEEYKTSFEEGEEKYNQILVIHNVFSGGNDRDGDGEIEYGGSENEKEIPNGEYDLVDNKSDDKHPDWYRIDSKTDGNRYNDRYDDPTEKNSKGKLRDGFRLHLGGMSWGCVTICRGPEYNKKQKEWNVLNQIIQTTETTTVNDRRGRQSVNPLSRLTVYGTITVSGQNPKPKQKKSN
ncbi:RHS repeat-associated protein [Aquimarina sp. MAR_2010_214]|uniref:DUF6443 domain-containing protein n=1 Tax=Aquimarina sp. MAR_2010_214 TaxID=1250026 RepID=UPI000C71135A|nr:DUF6443 domain-containing protein [Aquimarina sp. MAR_2010_214]PKV52997.1 RHS repeat-associated protein [Aquimarina sp. MAR_2010_214]